jgi:Fic family protein
METLKKADQLKNELDNLRPLNAEAEARIMQKFRLDWNYHSNKLEGNSYTYGETKMLLLYGLTAGGKPIKDHEEISGHNEAIETLIEVIKDETPLTETFIRHLHKLILVKPEWVEAKTADGKPTKRLIKVGEYKTEPNHVETKTGEMFYFAEPIETPAKMQELIKWFYEKKESKETNPIIIAAEFHYKFIRIHPFDDGNGRMARLLMNFILMQNGFPPVIIKDNDKENYIAVLRQADFGILEPFIEYIAQNLVRSLEIMIKGAKGEGIEEPDDLDKELALLEREIRYAGTNISFARSMDSLTYTFENSIFPLIMIFFNKCEKFNKFYESAMFGINYFNRQENTANISFNEIFTNVLKIITESDYEGIGTNIIKGDIFYTYNCFLQNGFGRFSFTSKINLIFETNSYSVSLTQKTIIKKYSEQIINTEIEELCNFVISEHKNLIRQKLSDITRPSS